MADANVVRLPVRGSGRAKMPAWLSPEERKVWKRLAPLLEKRGLLSDMDAMGFAALCTAAATVRLLSEKIGPEGLNVPLMREKARWEKELLCWLKEFGMTPNSRARLRIPVEPDPNDPSNEFFNL